MKNTKRICIGKISSSHGVKGLVKIAPFCEDINLLNGELFTEETGGKTLNITLKNSSGKYILAQIDGITSPEQAKLLKSFLFVPRETLPEINNKDEFYIEDLAGLNVLNTNDDKLGTLIAMQDFGAGSLLEIKPIKGDSYFLPFQNEYVTDVNIDQQTITVQNLEDFIIE